VSATCFDLPSQVVEIGGVLCWVRLFLFMGMLCGGMRFGAKKEYDGVTTESRL
jgi:hypothetical protein